MLRTVWLFIAGTLLISCTKKPEAIISSDKTEIVTGERVTFTNTSENAETYLWDFGDGVTTAQKDPIHTFEEEGTFPVSMTAYSKSEKKSDAAFLTIFVKREFEKGESSIMFKGGEHEMVPSCYLYSQANYTLTGVGNNGNIICNIFLPGEPTQTKTYQLQESSVSMGPDEACVVIKEEGAPANDIFWRSLSGDLKITVEGSKVTGWYSKINFTDQASGNSLISSGQITCP